MPDPLSTTCPPTRRRRWRRRLLILTVLLVVLYLGRAPILCGLAHLLITEESAASAEYLVLVSGGQRHERAAAWFHEDPQRHLLLFSSHPERVEVLGLRDSPTKVDFRALHRRGVPDEAMTIVPGDARTDWQRIRELEAWLAPVYKIFVQ